MSETLTQLWTPKGQSYWGDDGIYNEQMSKLYDELVPSKGKAETIHGELIRSVNRLIYDYCNNGNCNVIEIETVQEEEYHTCNECGGSGEVENWDYDYDDEDCTEDEFITCDECCGDGETMYVEEYDGEISINRFYQDMIDFIRENLPRDKHQYVNAIEDFIQDPSLGYSNYTFSDDEQEVYNRLADVVMHEVLNTENKKINYGFELQIAYDGSKEWTHEGFYFPYDEREVMQTFNWYVNRIEDKDTEESRSVRLFKANEDGDLVVWKTKFAKVK